MKEKASLTGRRWRRALLGRKSLKSFLHAEASPVTMCHMHLSICPHGRAASASCMSCILRANIMSCWISTCASSALFRRQSYERELTDVEGTSARIANNCSLYMQCRDYLADYAPLVRQELKLWEKTGIHKDLLDRSRDANVRLPALMPLFAHL